MWPRRAQGLCLQVHVAPLVGFLDGLETDLVLCVRRFRGGILLSPPHFEGAIEDDAAWGRPNRALAFAVGGEQLRGHRRIDHQGLAGNFLPGPIHEIAHWQGVQNLLSQVVCGGEHKALHPNLTMAGAQVEAAGMIAAPGREAEALWLPTLRLHLGILIRPAELSVPVLDLLLAAPGGSGAVEAGDSLAVGAASGVGLQRLATEVR
mmetsp:Transcript_104563/g.248898  ORF Transcript_104563/g.248898 Transcript_104563/m.248898 type:complete len:206 (+) Transcript_104563:2855-3472(+)